MKYGKTFLGFCAFAIFAGVLLALCTPENGSASGPSPVPFVPHFGAGAPTTPPDPTNQTYSDTSANYATYLYQGSTLTWRKISNGGAGSGVAWPLTGDVVISTGTDTPAGLAPINGDCLQGNSVPAWVVAACPSSPPGGSSGQIQYNNAGAFGGFTLAGDCTLIAPTITCTTLNGVAPGFFYNATATTATANLNVFTSLLQGVVPASGGGTANFLRADGAWATPPAGSTVTWPANGSAVISNTTNSPAGVAEINGDVLIGSAGAWIAGPVPLSTVTGGICTITNFSIQFDNTGAMGCAPAIINSGVFDFTGTNWQVGGVKYFSVPAVSDLLIGTGAGGSVSGGTSITAVGRNACNKIVGNNGCTAVGDGAGQNDTGASDTFVGVNAGNQITSGQNITCIGFNACAGGGALAGDGNTAVGTSAGVSFTSGSIENALFGQNAGEGITSGTNNICIGYNSCEANTALTTGSGNIVLFAGITSSLCAVSSASVSNEFDLCGNGLAAGNASPIMRCNLVSIAAGNCIFNVPVKAPGYLVSTLPATPPTGSQAYVTDAVACTFLATLTGGGSAFCPVIYNGSAWVAA